MSKQNIYDNDIFFEDFKQKRSAEVNFNDCIETPIILSMLPDLRGKCILDIGCGMGQHAKQYSDLGAKAILGIDISAKMLSYAKEYNNADNITYTQMAMEDIELIDRKFDVITSSFVFDYIEDFDSLLKNIHNLLQDNGTLVFSMSHPVATAFDGTYPRFTKDENGKKLYANVSNYAYEGKRVVKWVVEEYEFYHRTLSSMINSLINAGFKIDKCRESIVSPEILEAYPGKFDGVMHRPDFIFFKCSKI